MAAIGLGEALLRFSASPPGLEQFGIVTGTNIFSFTNDSENSSDKGNKLYITHSGLFAYDNTKGIFQALQGINVGDFKFGNTGFIDFDKAIHTILFEDTQFNSILGSTGTCMISLKPEFLISITGPTGPTGQLGLYTNTSLVYPSTAISADGIAPSQPPTSLANQYAVNGWYFKNTVSNSKINWYLPPSLDMTVGDLLGLYITLFNASTTSNDNMPFITVYTVPTGSGDFFPGFFHSSMTYIINTTPVTNKYYTAFANIKNARTPPYYSSTLISMIQSPVSNPKGTYLSSEKILAFTIGSNSSSPTNSVEFVIQKLGVITTNTTQELLFLNNSIGIAGTFTQTYGATTTPTVPCYLVPNGIHNTVQHTTSNYGTRWVAPVNCTLTAFSRSIQTTSSTAVCAISVSGGAASYSGSPFSTATGVVSGLNIAVNAGQYVEIQITTASIGDALITLYFI